MHGRRKAAVPQLHQKEEVVGCYPHTCAGKAVSEGKPPCGAASQHIGDLHGANIPDDRGRNHDPLEPQLAMGAGRGWNAMRGMRAGRATPIRPNGRNGLGM